MENLRGELRRGGRSGIVVAVVGWRVVRRDRVWVEGFSLIDTGSLLRTCLFTSRFYAAGPPRGKQEAVAVK